MNYGRVIPLKVEKKFNELLGDCSKQVGNCFGLAIKENKAFLTGVDKKTLTPDSAIVLIQQNRQLFIKGFIDGVNSEFSSFEHLDASEVMILGVDCRTYGNSTIYYKSGETTEQLTEKSEHEELNILCIYWEYASQASLTICTYDSSREKLVREVVSATNEPTKRFLRAIAKTIVQTHEIRTDYDDEFESNDFFVEDYEDNDDEQNWI